MLKYLGSSPEEKKPKASGKPASSAGEDSKSPAANPPTVSPGGETPEEQVQVLQQKIEALERRIGYLERIVKLSQILNSTLHLEPLLQIIIQSATELTDTEACSIMLLDKNTGELRFAAATGDRDNVLKKMLVPLDNSIAGWVIRKNRPLLIRDARKDPRWHSGVDESTDFQTRSLLGVPLKLRDKTIGVMELVNKKGDAGFNEDDIQIATTLSAQAAIAIENARLLDELQQAYRDLSEIERLKNDFVSIASHELRTPLAVILGYATFLRDNLKGKASEQLDVVLSSAMRLRALIDDMVNLRHIQTGDLQLQRSIFSLKALILEAVEEFSELASGKQQTLTTRFIPPNDPLNIDADRQRIYLVLANLLSNAIKFTPEKGRIHVQAELKGHRYWVSVIDTGIGIPKSEYERIFNQFYQVEPPLTRRYQGMGIGLSIAKGMVEEHQGRIWVESVVNKGSKFTFVLPTGPDVADKT
ncbi:MAG: GAF domain-containing protein [Chloroflexi bacterium]|nr:MAG: GAF domain-containing protein [Chloroflexota bacterium]